MGALTVARFIPDLSRPLAPVVNGAEALNAKTASTGVEGPAVVLRRIWIVADPSPTRVMLPRFATTLTPTNACCADTTTTGAGNVHVPAGNVTV